MDTTQLLRSLHLLIIAYSQLPNPEIRVIEDAQKISEHLLLITPVS